ncbi:MULTISPECIES: helix-turn-helix domain-containing protein [unclassified Streptomyces]|uniref:helix-turn-helix domain-containing protein n=1 Tax=unclassified Streptomyces TaxID=2593676 RepID=UPI002E29711E|nr:helix-turn-helix domain-containing protein [Streptomyces sp. NBC_00223]
MTRPHPATVSGEQAATGSEDTARFGALIRGHRLRIGLTQRELADLSTISMRAIRNLEQGRARRPRPETIRLIADALRLGDRARAALESAVQQRHFTDPVICDLSEDPPAPPTALHPAVGREAETAVLVRELIGGVERLVNVVGLSGVGKSRLALEVADRLHGEGLPVLWFAFPGAAPDYLSSMESGLSALVSGCVADLYGPGPLSVGAGAGSGGVDVLTELVGERQVLLVLDGAPAEPPRPERLSRLLRDCPGLRMLVTGDRPWDVPGERTFLLGPLDIPPARVTDDRGFTAFGDIPAVRVFLSQLRRVRPEFAPSSADLAQVAEICRRLDGLPMALAAAASWLMVYDLPTLRDCAGSDPAPLLDHLAGGDGGRYFRQALHHRLRRLPAGQGALLAALCARPQAEFDLADVVALTGRAPGDCGRMVRDLLIHGVIRTGHDSGRAQFQVLRLVRALHPAARAADGSAPVRLAAAAG